MSAQPDADTVEFNRVYRVDHTITPAYAVFFEDGGCITYFEHHDEYRYYEYPQTEVTAVSESEERRILMALRRYLRECLSRR